MTAFVFMWKHRDEYTIAKMAKVLWVLSRADTTAGCHESHLSEQKKILY